MPVDPSDANRCPNMWLLHAGMGPGAGSKAVGASAAPNRDLEGKLYAGHESFDWLLAVISTVMAAEVRTAQVNNVCSHAASCW